MLMNDTLKRLLDLQNLDKEIMELKREQQGIVEKLRAEQFSYQEVADKFSKSTENKKQEEVDKKKLELDIQQAEEKIKKLEEQQSMVKKNKEYQALSKEIKEAKEAKNKAEEDLVAFLEEIEEKQVDLEKQAKNVEEVKAAFFVNAKQAKEEVAEFQTKIKKYLLLRKELVKQINPKYISQYNNLYEKRAPNIIVSANNNICGGCNISIPVQVVADILNLKEEDDLIICENCGRILYVAENKE